jgi:hypothetical protein
MENILSVLNLAIRPRWVSQDGVLYVVAPMTLIVPGVLNGSQGPLLYELIDLQNSVEAWNGVPILLGHPDGGMDAQVFDATGLGWVRNAKVTTKLIAEAWFDVERVKRVHNELLGQIKAGKSVEVSTGVAISAEYANGVDSRGRAYDRIARNYRPDHLAVLVGQKGACSIDDGCGVNNSERILNMCTCNNAAVDQSNLLGLPTYNFENPIVGAEAVSVADRGVAANAQSQDLLGLPSWEFQNPLEQPKPVVANRSQPQGGDFVDPPLGWEFPSPLR